MLLGQALLGLGVGLLWLLILGLYQQFSIAVAALFIAVVVFTFIALHVYLKRPTSWNYNRLAGFNQNLVAPSMLVVMLLTALQINLFLQFGEPPTSPTLALSAGNDNLWLLAGAAIIAAPLIEEFGFRLWLQSPLEALTSPTAAVAISAVVFTGVHGLEGWYSHLLSGLCYGTALWLSQSIWLPIFMHALSNLLIALLNSSSTVTDILRHWMLNDSHLLPLASIALAAMTALAVSHWVKQLRRYAA